VKGVFKVQMTKKTDKIKGNDFHDPGDPEWFCEQFGTGDCSNCPPMHLCPIANGEDLKEKEPMTKKTSKKNKDIYNPWSEYASSLMLPNGRVVVKGTRKFRKIMKKWKKQQKKKEKF